MATALSFPPSFAFKKLNVLFYKTLLNGWIRPGTSSSVTRQSDHKEVPIGLHRQNITIHLIEMPFHNFWQFAVAPGVPNNFQSKNVKYPLPPPPAQPKYEETTKDRVRVP